MNFTDPTYLRSIVDGLSTGYINKDNAKALPVGLVGIYEEALPPANNVNERKKFLEFFGVWALLKKEVSVTFVLPLLEDWTEQEVLDYIGMYSKWFNSPDSGKYVLYHERLRAFIQQKIAHAQFTIFNEHIISTGQSALTLKQGDEWERYALEYLSTHLLIKAIETGNSEDLKTLAYNTTYWNRQIEISKGFEWSKSLLNDMMLWSSKYDDEEVIECALNKVDLYHLEQNDAPRIVEMVAQNDIETALNRIEAFGGSDKEGLQRKFILYMLCLMELTLLESKDKPFRKEAIEKLLKHLDDNLPVDHSILNWNDFFPSYLMFQMACEWAEMELDYLRVYKLTNSIDSNWIKEKGPYTDKNFKLLIETSRGVVNNNGVLMEISIQMSIQGEIEKATKITQSINNKINKSRALKEISYELAKQGKIEESSLILNQAFEITQDIKAKFYKNITLIDSSKELAMQGKVEEALEIAKGISDNREKSHALKNISTELAKQGKVEEVIKVTKSITDEFWKISALMDISTAFAQNRKFNEAETAMAQAIEMTRDITDGFYKSSAFVGIYNELNKQGKIEQANFVMAQALQSALGMNDVFYKHRALKVIATEITIQGKLEEATSVLEKALEFDRVIVDDLIKISTLRDISNTLYKQGKIEEARSLIYQALELAQNTTDEIKKSSSLIDIAIDLTKQGSIKEALEISRDKSTLSLMVVKLTDVYILSGISTELANQRNIKEAESVINQAMHKARELNDIKDKCSALVNISSVLTVQGKVEEASLLINQALEITQNITNLGANSRVLLEISNELAKQSKIKEALEIAQGISKDIWKSRAFLDISAELFKQKKIKESELVMYQATEIARGITNLGLKSRALRDITTELAKQENWLYAERLSWEIPQGRERYTCWERFAECANLNNGWINALKNVFNFDNPEVKTYYFKGMARIVSSTKCNRNLVLSSRHFFNNDITSIRHLLQQFALNELFFTDAKPEKIERFNRTLNIQWAIDIKNSFTAN